MNLLVLFGELKPYHESGPNRYFHHLGDDKRITELQTMETLQIYFTTIRILHRVNQTYSCPHLCHINYGWTSVWLQAKQETSRSNVYDPIKFREKVGAFSDLELPTSFKKMYCNILQKQNRYTAYFCL